MMISLSEFLEQSRIQVNQALIHYLQQQESPFVGSTNPALAQLQEASIYSVSNGGKRLRPALVYAVGQSFAALEQENLNLMAAAIECLHSYSLVHDDLPAMDDDELRRGKPTCHIAYDEATAILVGDGLQTFAFELLSRLQLPATTVVSLINYFAKASGNLGMVGGQMMDLKAQDKQQSLVQLEAMHRLKTGALIKAAVLMPAIASNASVQELHALSLYADGIGLAFQVQDDILDIEADTQTLGKTQGKDVKNHKSTYPQLLGLEGAKVKAFELISTAHQALDELPQETSILHQLADFITQRKF